MLRYSEDKDKIFIDVKKLVDDDWSAWFYFVTFYDKLFPDYESYVTFFLELGLKHEDGIETVYLGHLAQTYTRRILIQPLIDRGILSEGYDEEGNATLKLNVNFGL